MLLRVLEENAALRAEVAALREENRRLKGLKGPPSLKPSGMDRETDPRPKRGPGERRRGAKNARLVIDEDRIVRAEAPAGSRFKGYEDFTVQDLVVKPHVIRYRRERWLTPHGETLVAPLPTGIVGHFGPEMRRFVLAQYHQGQITVERLTTLLRDLGVDISKRQVVRLLSAGQDGFLDENRAVLRAGLETASWITVDDTGARHADRNGICTRIGNDRFAWFATTFSKSRRNFLDLLRAGFEDYVINAAALDYMRARQLPGPVIARLASHKRRRFATEAAWTAHLEDLAISPRSAHPDPLRIATEGALWGSIVERGWLTDTVILSDDAGQFNVGRHALCWVHAERLVHKLDTFSERQRRARERIQARIWWLYADLKAYCRDPTPGARRALRMRFDRLFKTRTGFATLDRLLARLHANRDELLMVLDRPDVPLHTNDAENDIRCQVTRRKISGGTRSAAGRNCRDAFLGLMKTCAKLGIPFWDYLGCRLDAPGTPHVAPLPQLIRQAAST
ncbi:MAG: transposase [Rhodospirillales bacterium]